MKLLLYTFILPSSIPELRERLKTKELHGGTNYIGSVTQKEGKLVYEGITPEIKQEIQNLVERIIANGLWLNYGKKIKVKKDGKILEVERQLLSRLIKQPDDLDFLNALEEELNFGHYRISIGEDLLAKVEYTPDEAREMIKRIRAEAEEILEWEEFVKKYPEDVGLVLKRFEEKTNE